MRVPISRNMKWLAWFGSSHLLSKELPPNNAFASQTYSLLICIFQNYHMAVYEFQLCEVFSRA